jgi:two-component system, NarL family, response regulator NreC
MAAAAVLHSVGRVAIRVLIAGNRPHDEELRAANGDVEIVGRVRSLSAAEEALRTLHPSVLVLDEDLTHHDGLCSLSRLRRASPQTAVVLPPIDLPGPRLVRAVRVAARGLNGRTRVNGLTARERDIVRLVALGHTNREIADQLVLSVRTVEKHRARIQTRLELKSRAQLIRWALDQGLLEA